MPCGIVSGRLGGNLTSPGYPAPYDSYSDCEWIIIAPETMMLLDAEVDVDSSTMSTTDASSSDAPTTGMPMMDEESETVTNAAVEEDNPISVRLYFHVFGVETSPDCLLDYLEVRDGMTSGSPLLARLCGFDPPEFLQSSERGMYVRFVSDRTVAFEGVVAEFRVGECGVMSSGATELFSPGAQSFFW